MHGVSNGFEKKHINTTMSQVFSAKAKYSGLNTCTLLLATIFVSNVCHFYTQHFLFSFMWQNPAVLCEWITILIEWWSASCESITACLFIY